VYPIKSKSKISASISAIRQTDV